MSRVKYDYLVKAMILGTTSLDRINILLRMCGMVKNHLRTIGIDFKITTVRVQDKNIKLQIWDSPSLNEARSNKSLAFKGITLFFVVFDLTDSRSFEYLHTCHHIFLQEEFVNGIVILIGNNMEIRERRAILWEAAKKFADKFNMFYIETSDKTGQGIQEALLIGAELVLNKKR